MASFFFSGSFQFNQESEQIKWNQKERNGNKIEKKRNQRMRSTLLLFCSARNHVRDRERNAIATKASTVQWPQLPSENDKVYVHHRMGKLSNHEISNCRFSPGSKRCVRPINNNTVYLRADTFTNKQEYFTKCESCCECVWLQSIAPYNNIYV